MEQPTPTEQVRIKQFIESVARDPNATEEDRDDVGTLALSAAIAAAFADDID